MRPKCHVLAIHTINMFGIQGEVPHTYSASAPGALFKINGTQYQELLAENLVW